MTDLQKSIFKLLPTNSKDAISKDVICEKLDITKSMVSQEIKRIRMSGVPILWNRLGIFIDYNPGAISRQSNIIENMKNGYLEGMTNIQIVYRNIINGDYERKDL